MLEFLPLRKTKFPLNMVFDAKYEKNRYMLSKIKKSAKINKVNINQKH
jgi:hypothetical protein